MRTLGVNTPCLFFVIVLSGAMAASGAGGDRIAAENPRELVRVVFPQSDKIFFSLPITAVVFQLTEEARRAGIREDALQIEIDGRVVAAHAVRRSHVLTGKNYGVFSAGAPWSLVEGGHRVTIRAKDLAGEDWESTTSYVIESSHPTTSGLSGFITFPSNEAIFSRSARAGVALGQRGVVGKVAWLNIAPLQFHKDTQLIPIPVEIGLNHRFSGPRSGAMNLDWKLEAKPQERTTPGVAVGQSQGSLFAVAGWHSTPNIWQASVGVGVHRLPSFFAGASYGPSFYRLMVEADNRRRVNYGLSLTHPRGLRLSLFNLQSGLPRRTWQTQLSFSRGL